MYTSINISGENYPVSFGLFALKEFEDATGVGAGDLVSSIALKPISTSIDLFFFAFKDGHRKAKIEFKLTAADIADLFDEDSEALNKMYDILAKSQPVINDDKTAENEKK